MDKYVDAKALYSFFKWSGMKHLFITGSAGSGKTTLINGLADIIRLDTSDKTGYTHKTYKQNCFRIIDELSYIEGSGADYQNKLNEMLDNGSLSVIAVLPKEHITSLATLMNRKDAFIIDLDKPYADISCIIMASGKAKRFGSNKLLEQVNGISLIENAVNIVEASPIKYSCIVTNCANVSEIFTNSPYKNVVLHTKELRNEVIEVGMSHIQADVYKGSFPDGIMFLQADQPLILRSSMHLMSLIFTYCKDNICRLSYNGVAASPVIFPKKYFNELLHLPSHKGGTYIINKHQEAVVSVPAYRQDELLDIDTKDELKMINNIVLSGQMEKS